MRVADLIGCDQFPCLDVQHGRFEVCGVEVGPGLVRLIMIAEAPPPGPGDSLFATGLPFHLDTTLDAFRAAGAPVSSLQDILGLGVYPTTALKCAKTGYAVARESIEHCSHLLEREIDLFPEARALLLMGDVAITALNVIARRRGLRRAIPAGPTYKVRRGEYWFEGKRAFPSYLQTGKSYLIERSKREMIAEDLRAALAFAGG